MFPNRRAICGEILTLALAGLLATSACAQNTVVASTSSGGNWTDSSTWTCSLVVLPCVPSNGSPPGTGYNVEINAGNVLLNGTSSQLSASVNSISNTGTLSIYDGEGLVTSGNVVNSAGLFVGAQAQASTAGVANGSTLIVGGNLTNAGALQLGNGVVSGTVTVNGTLDNSNGQIDVLGGDTTGSQSTLTIAGEAAATLTGYTFLDGNKAGAVLNYQGGGLITQIGKGLFTPGMTLVLYGPNASIEAEGRGGDSALAGVTSIATGGGLQLYGGAAWTTAGNLANAGSLYVYAGSSMTVAGTFNNTGGLVRIDGSYNSNSASTMTVNGAAPSVVSGNLYLQGGAGGAVLNYGSGGITQIGNGTTGVDAVYLDGGNTSIGIAGQTGNSALSTLTTIAGNGALALIDGTALATTTSLTNNGFLGIGSAGTLNSGFSGNTSGSALTVGGELINNGVIELGTSSASGTVTVNGTFDNAGKVYLNGGAVPSVLAVSNLVNTGTINYNGGVLSIGGTPGAAGVINIGPHDSLTDDGVLNIGTAATPGTVNTAGKLSIGNAGSLNLVGNGRFTQRGGVTDVDGTLIAPTVTVTAGALTGAGTIQGNVTADLGYLQAGDPTGTFDIGGNLTLSDSLLGEDIESATGFGVLDVTGMLTLCDLDLLATFGSSDFIPTHGEIFDIVNAGSITGTFSNPYAPFADGAFRIELSSTGCSSGSACIDLVWNGRGGHTPATEPSSLLLLGVGLLVLTLIHLRRHNQLPHAR